MTSDTTPELFNDSVTLLKSRYSNVSRNVITNILLVKLAQMLTSKRVKYSELGKKGFPNHYAIIFMPSGYGKDKMSNELDSFFLKLFRLWFKDKANDFRNTKIEAIKRLADIKFPEEKQLRQKNKFIADEISKIRDLPIEISKGTPEGLFADAKSFQEAEFGSITVKYGEFGLMLKNARPEDCSILQSLFELYDGKLSSKSIKSENNQSEIDDLPCNVLFYSDPTLFADELKKVFNEMMQTGLGRRAVISYLPEQSLNIETDPEKAYERDKEFASNAEGIGTKLFSIFLNLEMNSEYVLTEDTYKTVFYPYKIRLTEEANKTENSLLKREILSRELKALKISCVFAVLNHVKEHSIHQEDMEQAISTVDMISEDFKSFIKIRPAYKDLYDRVFEFFKENIGKEYSITDLKRKYYKNFGCGRKAFNKDFDEIMSYVAEIATDKGYLFNVKDLQPTGKKYSLTETPSNEINENIKPLTQLLG